MFIRISYFIIFILTTSCKGQTQSSAEPIPAEKTKSDVVNSAPAQIDSSYRAIHVFVALCDNKYQGIVPVPAGIGNGQDPKSNLYWGTAYGIKSYFKKSKEWTLEKLVVSNPIKLERLVFKHRSKKVYLVADAYDGKYIKECTVDFLRSSSGQNKDTMNINGKAIGIGGNSSLLAYIGHDGLMDFQLSEHFVNVDEKKRDIIILACYSKAYFSNHLKEANVNPIVWTSGLMAPEAYTVHDALTGYLNDENNQQIRTRAALAYSKYQKCTVKAAMNLLVTGW
jgi:hypothetical protein